MPNPDHAVPELDVPQPENAPPEKPEPTFTADFKSILGKLSSKASEGGAPKNIRRRLVTFVLDHELCEPGAFEEDFKLTLEGLSSGAELDALKESGEGTSMGFALAKRSIKQFNGKALRKHEVEVLWDLLGFAGRLATVDKFMEHCTGVGDGASLGKSLGVELG
jgi:hypothetical protein